MMAVGPGLGFLATLLAEGCPVSIVDIGANPIGGDVPYRALMSAGVATVTGFEPQPEALARLDEQKSAVETYLPYALGDGQPQRLHVYRNSGFTSIFAPDRQSARLLGFLKGMKVVETLEIGTRRLDDVPEVTACDFLKIDVQGSEQAILDNGAARLTDAVAVQVELRFFPLYEGEPSFGDVSQALTRQGFRFFRQQTTKHVCLAGSFRERLKRAAYAQAVDGDAIFVRDLRLAESFSTAQLCKLALIAEGVLHAPDLVLFCLERLVLRQAVAASSPEDYFALLPDDVVRGRVGA